MWQGSLWHLYKPDDLPVIFNPTKDVLSINNLAGRLVELKDYLPFDAKYAYRIRDDMIAFSCGFGQGNGYGCGNLMSDTMWPSNGISAAFLESICLLHERAASEGLYLTHSYNPRSWFVDNRYM